MFVIRDIEISLFGGYVSMESYDNYSGHRKMSVVERFPLFRQSVIGGSTVVNHFIIIR